MIIHDVSYTDDWYQSEEKKKVDIVLKWRIPINSAIEYPTGAPALILPEAHLEDRTKVGTLSGMLKDLNC